MIEINFIHKDVGGILMTTKLKKSVAKLVAKASYKEAEKNANSTCIFLHGQPQMPESVKKLNMNKK